ncbi:hypothetical protein IFR05_014162 [Cadophora sp. M221]|nr:hypothetical protein IFR05_014162 [Cadophora sp. M221]
MATSPTVELHRDRYMHLHGPWVTLQYPIKIPKTYDSRLCMSAGTSRDRDGTGCQIPRTDYADDHGTRLKREDRLKSVYHWKRGSITHASNAPVGAADKVHADSQYIN